ncbi:glycerophosphodiester phosphodiesterase [Aeromicrobium wangtongii]|uniref:glycerophosphodiester phosphodiesterase n=1 Tax=Aeromicrobium wangtongii TaxID=2969247 RepID=UPI00201747CF|nr:glycerophosphodiester phosphodiesterase [Aeromicrobium wangtongii]MCL3817191.1 glycerophosphodiester phosphodiesterase [Aeromicrobium wangtongii]
MTLLQATVRPPALVRPPVTVFAHRGASGYRPEHTLAAYELAIRLGADYIEPDLVSTRDGVLVARHENEISGTTDVAAHPEFAGRRTTKIIDGTPISGWFTEDFTLRELRTLRAEERLPGIRPANTRYDGRFEIPTFDQILDLAAREGHRHRRTIGVAPETKHPTYFASIGLPLERPLVRSLRRAGLDSRRAKVVIQSFETGNLRELSRRTRVPLVQLTAASGAPYDLAARGDVRTYADLMSPAGLREIATYAQWLGPAKHSVIPRDPAGRLGRPTSLVTDAHRAGLKVVAYTFRDENQFLPADLRIGTSAAGKGDVFGEMQAFFAAGIDGAFCDHADTARAARDWWRDQGPVHARVTGLTCPDVPQHPNPPQLRARRERRRDPGRRAAVRPQDQRLDASVQGQ